MWLLSSDANVLDAGPGTPTSRLAFMAYYKAPFRRMAFQREKAITKVMALSISSKFYFVCYGRFGLSRDS
jgi:hypothetical protein